MSDLDYPVQAERLTKTYRLGFFFNKTINALNGLDFRVPRGSVFGLLGPNGAGKSTTIKLLLNLVTPSSGAAKLFGQPPTDQSVRRRLGFVPENPAPYNYLTGREFMSLSGRLANLSGHELDQQIVRLLGEVDLSRSANVQVRRYSKGMVQRLVLAQSLLGAPELLILDEPTSGLDPIGRRQIRDLILAQREKGTTILFCTHIIPDVEAVCDQLVILVGGRKITEGPVASLLGAGGEVELVVEGISEAELSFAAATLKRVERRLVFRVPEAESSQVVSAVLQKGGRVVQLNPVRQGVEEVFLQAVREAGHTVGSESSS
jgi:ABC-2 type transport system ATP-binding protein